VYARAVRAVESGRAAHDYGLSGKGRGLDRACLRFSAPRFGIVAT